VVALIELQVRSREYSSLLFNVLEYLILFVIVTLHEFGHSLACRQVGGTAERIVLWPLGGVAYVIPPQRPAPTLWSLAAGPLVNVALVPVLLAIAWLFNSLRWSEAHPNLAALLGAVFSMNLVILVFNLLPVYPLDGGQILRSLLWFGIGRARSLMAATLVGFLGVAALGALALREQSVWFGIMAFFVGVNCWNGFKQARLLLQLAKVARRHGYACPSCGSEPPLGDVWGCARCGQGFDVFEFDARCPACGESFGGARCIDCNRLYPLAEWARPPGP
jgi:Zn-dependent protease/DNA-directed RNA polymerase subunit RPC12/RpoP